MGTLRHTLTGALAILETDNLVGRSARASLRIDQPYVSAQHASIRWAGNGWELKDLGSRNGTQIDEAWAKPGQAFRLQSGTRVAFGRADQTWMLIDDSPPHVMVVPLDGHQDPLLVEGELLALPSPDDPRATVFRGSDGSWKLEREDGVFVLSNQQSFEVAGQRWRFSSPEPLSTTSTVDLPEGLEVRRLHLLFRVTRDEEHVEITVLRGTDRHPMGSRSHNYLLLLLARRRLEEAGEKPLDPACGWMYQDDLIEGLRTSPERLNIDIFRIRKQFAAIGVTDAGGIVERRPRTKQVRIGVASLSVEVM